MKKKLQVFVSSTYIDLKVERQAAVESILDAGHIPAGMELFKAGNEDQLKTIKRWIDESDVYLLILGGRYGSLESGSEKSYTHLEYEYAIEKGMPVFATIISDQWLHSKAALTQADKVFEQLEQDKYKEFKKFVQTKVIRKVDDLKDIKLSIHTTLSEFKDLYKFSGWVKGSEFEDNTKLINENIALKKENKKLKESLEKQVSTKMVGDFGYEELKKVLKSKTFKIPASKLGQKEDIKTDYYFTFLKLKDTFAVGVTNSAASTDETRYLYYNIAPTLMSFDLVEKVKVEGALYERIQTSKVGLKFLAYSDIEESGKINN